MACGLPQFREFLGLGTEPPQTDFVVLIDFTSFEEPLLQYRILAFDGLVLPAKSLVLGLFDTACLTYSYVGLLLNVRTYTPGTQKYRPTFRG